MENTYTLLKYFGFHAKNIDKALDLLELVIRDTYEFERISRIYMISFPNLWFLHSRSVYEEKLSPWAHSMCIHEYVLFTCEMCHAFDHDPSYTYGMQLKSKL